MEGRMSIPVKGKRFLSSTLRPYRLWGPPGLLSNIDTALLLSYLRLGNRVLSLLMETSLHRKMKGSISNAGSSVDPTMLARTTRDRLQMQSKQPLQKACKKFVETKINTSNRKPCA
jgi:hypothetical protein